MAHQWEHLSSYNEYIGYDHIKPTLGYYDASSVETMTWQLDLADKAGIDWFIFDTYFSLDTGEVRFDESFNSYISSPMRDRISFATMYCNNESLIPLNPYMRLQQFEKYLIWNKSIVERYENYLEVNGRPLYVLWRPKLLWNAFVTAQSDGKKPSRAELVREFKQYMREKLLKIHGSSAKWPILGSGRMPQSIPEAKLYENMGLEIMIPYNTGGIKRATGRQIEYDHFSLVVQRNNQLLYSLAEATGLSVVPCVPGYSKVVHRADGGEVINVSDAKYEALLLKVIKESKSKLAAAKADGKELVVLGAWNEWTNGHAIGPGKLGPFSNEYGRLNTVSRVFREEDINLSAMGSVPTRPATTAKTMIKLDFQSDLEVPYFSWVQEAVKTPSGLQASFDRRVRIEIPVQQLLPERGLKTVVNGRINKVGKGVQGFTVRIGCKMKGLPTWVTLKDSIQIPAEEKAFALEMKVNKTPSELNKASNIIRSIEIISDIVRHDQFRDQDFDMSNITISNVTFQ
jgi:hypothetical protein